MSYYITVNREPRVYQLTFEDIMYGLDESKLALQKDTRDTTTWKVDAINHRLIEKTDFNAMQAALRGFVERYQDLIAVEDKSTLYRSFKIPKRSGGLRQIDAPNDELKRALIAYKGSILLICHEPEFYRDIVTYVWDCSKWTTKII